MSTEQIVNFNDLNDFCDKIILETQKWRYALSIQTEEYTKLVKNNENACAKLWEIHQKVNILSFLQEKLQRDICECESNYNATLQRVEEIESKTIDNENCVHTSHSSIYENAEYLNNCLNNLEGFMEKVDGSVNKQPDVAKKLDSLPAFALLMSKQLQLLESLERKMYYISNETKRVEELQKRIVQDIMADLTRHKCF